MIDNRIYEMFREIGRDLYTVNMISSHGGNLSIRLGDRVIIKRLEEERKTASGIVIPDTAGEKPEQGEVVAVGDGRLLQDGTVRPLQVVN